MAKGRFPAIFTGLFITAVLAVTALPVLYRHTSGPCRVESDCRYRRLDMEEILALQEREKGGMIGLRAVSAWRFGDPGKAAEPITGKSQDAGAVYICGNMAVAFPGRVLSGSYEQLMRDGECAVTGELSYALFGSVDTAGCRILFEGKTYRIAAVTDRKELMILIPEDTGKAEKAAFLFQSRERLKEKMDALGFEIS